MLLIGLLTLSSCNDCAETTYYNFAGPNENVKNLIPYQEGQIYEFKKKGNSNIVFELEVLKRFDFEAKRERVEYHNTHLGIACERYDPLHVYTYQYNQTDLAFRYKIATNNYNTLSMMLGVNFNNEKQYLSFHDYEKIENYYDYPEPSYVSLGAAEIIGEPNNPLLNIELEDSITIGGKFYQNLYRMDTIAHRIYNNNLYIATKIYFSRAYYSTEFGFVRLITPYKDTFDLVD